MAVARKEAALRSIKLRPQTFRAAVERIDQLNRREQSLIEQFDESTEKWMQGWLFEVNNQFYRHFINNWDLGTARVNGVDTELRQTNSQLLDTLEQDLETELTERVQETYRDGYLMVLWDLYRSGAIDETDLEDTELPDEQDFNLFLSASVIAGITMAGRLRRWINDAKLRMSSGLMTALGREMTLNDSLFMFETLGDQSVSRFQLLGQAELQRAFGWGQREALSDMFGEDTYQSLVAGEIWLTRRDFRVCQLCASLDGQFTSLIPVDDTHPGCRCVKVPVLDYDLVGSIDYAPISLEQFKGRFFP